MSQISKKGAKSRPWALSREDAHNHDLVPFFGDLSQSEKNSEIKLPLKGTES